MTAVLVALIIVIAVGRSPSRARRSGSCASTSAPSCSASAACSGRRAPGSCCSSPASTAWSASTCARSRSTSRRRTSSRATTSRPRSTPSRTSASSTRSSPSIEVERYRAATSQIAQTTLRSVLGKADLDMLLSERERLNEALQQIIDEQTEPWGIKVTTVEIKDVGIPQGMQRAMARQAEAERERRAKVINAEGEFQASERLHDAAQIMSANPTALQLRYLQTLLELGSSQASTIVFPLPDRPPQAAAPGHAVRRHREAPAADRRSRRGRRTRPTDAPGGRRRARDRRRRVRQRDAGGTRRRGRGRGRGAGRAREGRGRARPGRPRERKP